MSHPLTRFHFTFHFPPILKCPCIYNENKITYISHHTFSLTAYKVDLLLHLTVLGDHSVKSEDFYPFFLNIILPKGQILCPWFQGAVTNSLQHLHFWEMIVLERKRKTFLLTPQTPWSRGKGFYNPPLGLQWRESFQPRGSTSRSTFYHLRGGSPAVNGTGPATLPLLCYWRPKAGLAGAPRGVGWGTEMRSFPPEASWSN